MVLVRLEKKKLDYNKYREIRFDNAANMAEVHGGVQCLLRNINGKAKFVPHFNHRLNLCGVHASAGNASAFIFFRVTERVEIFLLSNHQWENLSSHLKVMMTGLVTTGWNTRNETLRVVKTRFQVMIQAFDSLTSASGNLQTKGECSNPFALN